MTEDAVKRLFADLPGARLFVASVENEAPEAAWGDTFCYYDPERTEGQKWPFATLVTHDAPGWDEASRLDRLGGFRVNLHVGRAHVPQAADDVDYSESDVVLPHLQYAVQGWIAIVNPMDDEQLKTMTDLAHQRVANP